MAHQVLTHISHVGAEHSSWQRGIDFYNLELEIMQNRLQEVSVKNTKEEIRKRIEHFQNQILVQKSNLGQLSHNIDTHFKHMERDIDLHAQHLGNSTIAEHDVMRDRYIVLEKIVNDLRHEFNRFLSEVM